MNKFKRAQKMAFDWKNRSRLSLRQRIIFCAKLILLHYSKTERGLQRLCRVSKRGITLTGAIARLGDGQNRKEHNRA